MALRMGSSMFLVIFSSLFLSGLCRSTLSNQQQMRVIKTENGIYDCVDFYKQPAFNHPLLKNFTSKVMPNLVEIQGGRISGFGLKDGGCPIGTVPILRGSLVMGQPISVSPTPLPVGRCVAIVHTVDSDKKFYGVNGSPSVYKPVAKGAQWTATRIKLLNGAESIEAGWMVSPDLFKDNEAHYYAKFTAGGKECINLQCPGFVQVAKDAPLGAVPEAYSVIGGQQLLINMSIDKHQDDGNWWLSSNKDKSPIGYWPKELFTTLADFANQVEWGGEIGNPGLIIPHPEMGNGRKASYNSQKSATIVHATVVDESFKNVEPQHTLKVWDCENLYTVLDNGHSGDYFGRLIYYGGTQNV